MHSLTLESSGHCVERGIYSYLNKRRWIDDEAWGEVVDDDQKDIIAKMGVGLVTEAVGRTWAWLPNALKRRQLDLVFRDSVEPYLMTGHMWLQGTNVPVDGRWFRVGVLNKSNVAISGVRVQLVSVDPPGVVHTVPLRLHLMHDNPPPGQPNVETFTVEPDDEPNQFVDVVSRYQGQPGIQIEHIVPAVLKIYDAGQYTFTLKVSAPYRRSRTRAFSVGADGNGGLTFAQLS